jgi:hypothetical protein
MISCGGAGRSPIVVQPNKRAPKTTEDKILLNMT